MAGSEHDGDSISDRLVRAAVRAPTVEDFLSAAGRMFSSTPLKVGRVFLSLHTLHPAFRARTYLWLEGAEGVSVVEWPHGLRNRPGYHDSPDFHVHSARAEFRVSNLKAVTDSPCDLYGALAAQGYTDYLMLPLPFRDGTVNTFAIATKAEDGFPARELDRFRGLGDVLVLALERYTALETTNAALDTYLGRSAARQVLKGRIRSGYGEMTEAAILFADLDDFTGHAAHLDPAGTARLLNEYFDCLVGPIEENGGYVLKFIGDAVLAFFPVLEAEEKPAPLQAVTSVRGRLARLNRLRERQSRPLLHHALCVHFGRVLYGNVGSTERLDFTIIGEAVNIAARGVETAKRLHAAYVFTDAFRRRFQDDRLVSLGQHALRDIAGRFELFTLKDEERTETERRRPGAS